MSRYVAALKAQSAIAFKEALRQIDMLVIDDVQFLQGRQIQQEFCHTLNALIDGGRQIAVAADRPPLDLETLDERVRSRLAGGLAVPIGAPDYTLRRAIIEKRVAHARERHPAFEISNEIADFVARSIAANGRDLDGAINRLVAHNQLSGTPLTLDMVEVTLRDLIRGVEPRKVKIEDIQRAVALHFGVSKVDMLSSRRTRTVVRPRQVAMYLAKTMTPRSLPEIGRRFGNRDHTTVLHAVRKVDALLKTDAALVKHLDALRRAIEA